MRRTATRSYTSSLPSDWSLLGRSVCATPTRVGENANPCTPLNPVATGVTRPVLRSTRPTTFATFASPPTGPQRFMCVVPSLRKLHGDDLVTGLPQPLIQGEFIRLPDQPGLAVTLNEEVARRSYGRARRSLSDRGVPRSGETSWKDA